MDNRQIDAMVAEKVMGWQRWTCKDFEYAKALLVRPGTTLGATWQICETDIPLHESAAHLVPRYSADINEAWQVVEKINSLDLSNGDKNYQILAKFINLAQIGDDRSNLLFLSSTEAAKRISLAALKSVGVEIVEGEG